VHPPLSLPEPVIDISAGYHGACAVGQTGSVYCWLNPTETLSDLTAQKQGHYHGIELTSEPRLVELCPHRAGLSGVLWSDTRPSEAPVRPSSGR